jgi:catechol 2,3-dioxygenase-like lactoylglutathione lyase family enzyme
MNDIASVIRRLPGTAIAISPAKFAHVVLRTGQAGRMAEWYATVLGARIVFRDERLCFLTYDDEHHRVALIQVPGLATRDPATAGTDHIAYSFNDLGDLLATYRRLKAAGITPGRTINHGPTTSMYYSDPDNNRVELQVDNFTTVAELQAYFAGQDFADNPVGVLFDPEALIAEYEAGVPMADLLRRKPLPEGKSPWDNLSRS